MFVKGRISLRLQKSKIPWNSWVLRSDIEESWDGEINLPDLTSREDDGWDDCFINPV